jgi:MFS family permease
VTAEPVEKCPKCGKSLRSARQVRRLGWLQLACGVFITGLMGTVTYNVAPLMLRPGEETAGGGRFSGTGEQALLIFGIFGLVITFGLMAIVSGLYQIKTGRRNNWIFVVMLVLFGVLIAASWLVRAALGD